MDTDRQRIEQDLRGQLAGEVLCDPLMLSLFASDASVYEQTPLAVVRPRNTADVAVTLRYASERRLPVHARGAGSGLAGGAVGSGLVVDFSRFMRRVLSIGDDSALVQAGVVHAELNRTLAERGRCFGPDPAMSQVTTMGGVIAVDASGSRWPWCGSARDNLLALKVVLASGEVVEFDTREKQAPQPATPEEQARLLRVVADLGERHRGVIESHRSQSLVNSSGYALHHALEDPPNLAKLFCGSEGTLGLIVEAEVQTIALPAASDRVLLMFDSLDKAVRCAGEIGELNPAACDLMDRRHLTIAREADVRYDLIIPAAAEAVLLVEFLGAGAEEVHAKIDHAVRVSHDEAALAAGYHTCGEQEDERLLEQLPRRFTQTLHGMKGRRRAAPCIEDIAVPPTALPVFVRHLQDVLKRQQVTASLFAHAAHGQLHIRPLLDLRSVEDVRRMELLASELYEKVWLLGGTIAGEHGDGLSRTPFMRRQHGPLINVFREVKRLFDPHGILNPGKIIPTPGERMTQGLRRLTPAPGAPRNTVELKLNWEEGQIESSAWSCNGCGACRTQSRDERMCPIFRYAPREEASPRSKANLVRALLNGDLPPDVLTSDAARGVADLCVHCCQCRLECPATVDIPHLMVEAKAAHVRQNGLRPRDWFFGRLDLVSATAAFAPRLVNFLLSNNRSRWLLGRTTGLAPGRRLPSLNRRPFLRQARRLQSPVPGAVEKVVYFVDTFANYFDAQLAQALVSVLKHNQVGVVVPADQGFSAMSLITQGAIDQARKAAQRNVELLSEYARQGYAIVATEPSAVLALTQEYPRFLDDDDDVRLVAENSLEACDYLWRLHQRGALKLDLKPMDRRVAYHVPCHVKALGAGAPAGNLLRLVPRLRVNQLEKGCSGMAGLYGLRRENYRRSLRAGLPLLTELRTGDYDFSVSECSTCSIQMRQASSRPTLHPIKILAASYGLLPGLEAELGVAKMKT